MEEYLRGPSDIGSIVMAKFRSGTCLNEEKRRWGEDKYGETRSAECVGCVERVVETVKHVVVECSMRKKGRSGMIHWIIF